MRIVKYSKLLVVLIAAAHSACATATEPDLVKRGSLIILKVPGDGRETRDVSEGRDQRVQSLAVEAMVANWDQDAQWDGIELRVLPRAADGQIVPVNGTVAVDLLGREHIPERTTQGFPNLGSWSQAVRARDFTKFRGAVYYLPFREPDFESDLRLLSYGTIAATLHLPRQGVFQATTPIRLRTFNPVRDAWNEHQLHHDEFGRYRARHW